MIGACSIITYFVSYWLEKNSRIENTVSIKKIVLATINTSQIVWNEITTYVV